MRGASYDSNTELMDLYRSSSSTSWSRRDHADHVQALLNMSAAYLHAAANFQEDRPTHTDRWVNSWSVQQKKQRARRTCSADRYRHQIQHARRYSAGAEWRRRDNSETEDEDDLNEHLARCQCSCDHMGYTSRPQHHTQAEIGDNDSRIHYPVEADGVSTKPEVTFYPQGSSTPSSTSVASGTLVLIGAPRRWLVVLAVLLVAMGVGVGVPLALRAGNDGGTSLQEHLEMATRLLHEVPLVDGHNDLPWNIRKFMHNRLRDFPFGEDLRKVAPWSRSAWSHTDLPRLQAGLVTAQFWAAYVPCESQFLDAVQLTLEQIDVIRRLTEKYHPKLILCTSVADIRAAHTNGQLCSLIGVEGGHSLASSLPVLRTLYSVGVRYLTLTSNCNTPWADSLLVDGPGKRPEHNGLTRFGKAQKGGLVMINFYPQHLTCRNRANTDDAVAHINHVRRIAGVDSVGLGAGYDGINFTPEGLEDVSTYPTLFAALIRTGQWSTEDLKKLAGLNFLRVMKDVEKVRDAMRAAGVGPYEDDDTNVRQTQKNCTSTNLF
ncbi:hypothetical protein Cfor_12320 [Coptotermes formosanus]|uniref:Dipeptidase n=1 Tax=Coptotermes formosanus TaxID=36987 RepID=A0A6L2PRS7_COPFO|nr:hypothetical protein Cfor_12320 [Coptotermes formosanus]